jgi:hypothetical protein
MHPQFVQHQRRRESMAIGPDVALDRQLQTFALGSGWRYILLRPASSLDRDGARELDRNQQTVFSGIVLGVRSESENPMFLREPVRPVIFRNLPAWLVLAVPRLHSFYLN